MQHDLSQKRSRILSKTLDDPVGGDVPRYTTKRRQATKLNSLARSRTLLALFIGVLMGWLVPEPLQGQPAQATVTQVWVQRYNGPGNGDDRAQAVAVDASGNVVVTGYSVASAGNSDYYTAKYAAADGALLWEKRYNGPANINDQAQAVAVDTSGNVVVTGWSYNASDIDSYTAKYAAADGALLWERRYNGPANRTDEAQAMAVDGSGNVVVTGSSYHSANGFGGTDYYTAKYAAADGALLWEKVSELLTRSG